MYKGLNLKRVLLTLSIGALLISGCSDKTKNAKTTFIKQSTSRYKIDKTIEIVSQNLAKKNYKLVYTFDHEKEALKLKQMLYPTKTLEFSNNKIETKLISCNPSMSLELPIRLAVYNEINGQTHVAYTDPEYWSLKHNIHNNDCLKLLMLIKLDLSEAVEKIEPKEKK